MFKKQAEGFKTEHLVYVCACVCVYTHTYITGRKSIYNWQVEDFPYLKHLKENGAALKIHLQVRIAESASSRLQ